MSPAPPSPLAALTSSEATTSSRMFTPPTIVVLILLALLTIIIFGAILVFALRRQHRQSEEPDQAANFLDLEASGKRSPFFEVVDTDPRSPPSLWIRPTRFCGSRPQVVEPEPWPLYTVLPHLRPKEPLHHRMLTALAFRREDSKREPFTVADVQRTQQSTEGCVPERPVATRVPFCIWTWWKLYTIFGRKPPEIVIHPCDGSPAFAYAEDPDFTSASLRERRFLERCEAAALSAIEHDSSPASSEPGSGTGTSTSLIALGRSCSLSSEDNEDSELPPSAIPMRPSTPLGMIAAHEPTRSFVDEHDASDPQRHVSASGSPRVSLGLGIQISRFSIHDIFPLKTHGRDVSPTPSATTILEEEKGAPSNSSSESSVADIISVLDDISAEPSSSSDSLSLQTSLSDDSMPLQPASRKRFSGVFDAVKRVSIQSSGSSMDLDLGADGCGDFGRSTYYGILDEYDGRQESASVAAGDGDTLSHPEL